MTVPQTLIAGRYRLLEALRRGGMGRVWLARDEILQRDVAAKEILTPEGLSDPQTDQLRDRSLREARAAARLSHPNLVRVYDVVDTAEAPWIVMEYVPSRSLHEIVAEEGPLPPERAAQIGLALLAGLRAAHRHGVLHRDVKPANVLIAADGRVVLTDFGLATLDGDPVITRSGMILGSPSFLPPERALNGSANTASDLWSLGATLYFAVTGRAPYERGTTMATLAALATEEPPRVGRQAGQLRAALTGLLRRDPGARPDGAAVERMLRGAVSGTQPLAKRLPRRALAATTAGIAAALTLAALAAWAIRPGEPEQSGRWDGGSTPAPTTTVAPPPTTVAPPPTTTAAPPATGRPALPPGWRRYTDSTGFSLAVPADWAVSRRGTIVYFREPGGGRVLGIDQTDQPKPDPVADWAGKEEYRVNRGDFPSYRRVRLTEVDYFVKAADWEFTYLSGGTRVHVNNRGFITSPTQAYGMWWSTPDSQWARYLPDLRLIQRSFVPAR